MTLYSPEKLEIGKLYRSDGLWQDLCLYSQPKICRDDQLLQKSYIKRIGPDEIFMVIGPLAIISSGNYPYYDPDHDEYVAMNHKSYCTVEILTASEHPVIGYFHCHIGIRCFKESI